MSTGCPLDKLRFLPYVKTACKNIALTPSQSETPQGMQMVASLSHCPVLAMRMPLQVEFKRSLHEHADHPHRLMKVLLCFKRLLHEHADHPQVNESPATSCCCRAAVGLLLGLDSPVGASTGMDASFVLYEVLLWNWLQTVDCSCTYLAGPAEPT